MGKIPTKAKNKRKEIPWQKIAGMRNKLIHEYFGVNIVVVWKTVKEDLSDLKVNVSKILKDLGVRKLM